MDDEYQYTSPMEEVAISMHEMYITLKRAGFSRRDALDLVAKVLINGVTDFSDEDEYDAGDEQ